MSDELNIEENSSAPIPPPAIQKGVSPEEIAFALEHLEAVEKHAQSFVGKDGMNPFLWLGQYHVGELKRRITGPSVLQGDIDAAMEVPLKEPSVEDLRP